MPPPLLSEQAAFARHLFTQGYPLWSPDPVSLPQHLQSVGLRIGDLGTVDERGCFHVLLNIFDTPPESVDIPSNLQINDNDVRRFNDDILPREVVSSPETNWEVEDIEISTVLRATTRTTQYGATLATNGAHVVLPQGAQSFELAARHRKLLEKYARKHGADWLERYKDELGSPGSDSLYLLTGFYKTCSWCIASFGMETAANTNPVHVCCTTMEVDERIIQDQSAWRPTGRFKRKIGPAPDRQGRNNQAVFIRAITITPNLSEQRNKQQSGLLGMLPDPTWFLDKLMGDSGSAAATNTPQGDIIIQHVPHISQASHPSEIINRYLLTKVPSAKFAITHDSQWMAMIKSSNGPAGQSWTLQGLENHLEVLIPEFYSITTYNDIVHLKDKEDNLRAGDDVGGLDLSPGDLPGSLPPEEVSLKPELPSFGLPSLSNQASSLPLPIPFAHSKDTPRVERVTVDMLPDQSSVPQRKPSSTSTTASIPPTTAQLALSCDPNLPPVRLPASGNALHPRARVVDSALHSTPTASILRHDTLDTPQLTPPADARTQRQSRLAGPLDVEPSSSRVPAHMTEGVQLARQSDYRSFPQQSPDGASIESGKSALDASSAASSQKNSVLDANDDNEGDEMKEQDRRPTNAAVGEKHDVYDPQNKLKKGKQVEKWPLVKRSHSVKHAALPTARRLAVQRQPHRRMKKATTRDFGLESSERPGSATGSTEGGKTRFDSIFTTVQIPTPSPPQVYLPDVPKEFTHGRVAVDDPVPTGSTPVDSNTNVNEQVQKTILVANSSSEDYEAMDEEDSEEWASEEMGTTEEAREAKKNRLHETVMKAQGLGDLFVKVPKHSYSHLDRSKSGLSQLMNPDPAIVPPDLPYRISRSLADIPRQYQKQEQHSPVLQRSTNAYAPPRLTASKSDPAFPVAAPIIAVSSSKTQASSATKRRDDEKVQYWPSGPPKERETEDDSGDDADDEIQTSQSVAQLQLRALVSRRSSEPSTWSHVIQPVAVEVESGLSRSVTAPIPLGHPYNLPAAAPPMTPRATRRKMLRTELSESMRRQLLWERQVNSSANPTLVARRAAQGSGDARPVTSTSREGIQNARHAQAQDKNERRARNRSWAGEDRYSGW